VCSRLGKALTFDENVCFANAPEGGRALAAEFAQIRGTGTTYADFRFKSTAQASHLPTFASMSLQVRRTGIAYAHFCLKSAAQTPHMLILCLMSLQILCTEIAYAYFGFKSALASN